MAGQKKVDMFTADKAFSDRVVEFMHTQVWNVVVRSRLQKAREEYAQKLENLENLKGSIITDEQIEALKTKYAAELQAAEEELDALAEKEMTFSHSEQDKTFYKEYKEAGEDTDEIKKAIQKFCESYRLQIANTDFLEELTFCVSGVKKAGASTVIKSGAKKFTQTRSKSDVLCVLYGRLAEKMVEAGTLKAEKIPADVRDAYTQKKNK